ncbi:MAG: CbtB-domain containing protein [Salinisphaera sp.]|nr:CbtB-domain containing protein [Salinisphaera sp.]MDN5939027.1 CbtB-domain containing protein [Salinisphaera sp.]
MQAARANPAIGRSRRLRLANVAVQLAGAALLGIVIVYGVGFSRIMPVHNAAHDVRHSAAFPCH